MEDTGKLTTLGRYRLVRRIGRGGMGEVWLAEDPHLLRQVALKVLPLRKRDDAEFLARFEKEARAAAALHHPHILPVHDYGQQQMPGDQAITYLVMSYVSGGSVDDRLKALSDGQGTLTQEEALKYLFQVAEAIDYAHVHNIVHRDIKPGNMLLRDDNWLLLTDFGIARILTDADAFATGAYLGTPTYMAPEQAQGQAVPASDVYSLAVVAYQLFTGRVPFHADNPFALSFQHAFVAPTSPRVYNPALSPEFEVALLRGLEKDPAQRPRSATAYVTGLDQALTHFPSYLPTPVQSINSSVTSTLKLGQTRRNVLRGLGVGAGVLLVGGGVATYLVRTYQPHKAPLAKPTAAVHPPVNTAGAPLAIKAAFTQPVVTMAWSPGTNTLATRSQDAQLVLWDLTSARPSSPPPQLASLSPGAGFDLDAHLSWSPDGKMLAVANGIFTVEPTPYTTVIYDASSAGLVQDKRPEGIGDPNAVQGVTWVTKNFLATATNPKNDVTRTLLTLWNIQKPQQKPLRTTINQTLATSFSGGTNFIAASPSGTTLAMSMSGSVQLGRLNTSGQAPAWQAIGPLLAVGDGDPGEVAWSANGRYIAALPYQPSNNGEVGVWDATHQYRRILSGLTALKVPARLLHLAWSPGTLLALGGDDGRVYLWNVGLSPDPVRILAGNVQGNMTALAWSSDGHWLAASYDDSFTTILLWRM